VKVYPSHPLPGVRYEVNLVCPEGGVLPFDYRFKLSGSIYKMLDKVDSELGRVLHDRGFGRERFKFFVFSDLFIKDGKGEVNEEGIHLLPGASLTFSLSSLIPSVGERLVYDGILSSPVIKIGNLELYLEGISKIDIVFEREMKFKMISPTFIRVPINRGRKMSYMYILPHTDTKLFETKIAENIVRKVKVFAEIDVDISVKVDERYIRRRMMKLAKMGKNPLLYFRKVFNYKGGTIYASYVPIRLSGDIAAISMAYYAGVGHGNALGFGMLEVVSPDGRRDRKDNK